MSQSLDRLSSNLSEELFKYTQSAFPDPERFSLVKKKGVYPYDYMDSFVGSVRLAYHNEKIFIVF